MARADVEALNELSLLLEIAPDLTSGTCVFTEKVHTMVHNVALQRDDVHNEPGESGMDTFGALVDKLVTVNLKMWHNQEVLYEIRRMTKAEFVERWSDDMLELHEVVKRCCDLNVQRAKLMDEIDVFLEQAVAGEKEGDLVRKQHKTY